MSSVNALLLKGLATVKFSLCFHRLLVTSIFYLLSKLSIFKSVLTAVNSSTRFGGATYQNVQTIVTDAILSGFKLVLAAKRSNVSGKEEAKEISRKWKWYDQSLVESNEFFRFKEVVFS